MAVSKDEAYKFNCFMKKVSSSKYYLNLIEIIDLQRYRLVTKKNVISRMLSLDMDRKRFLFPFYKN